MESTDTNIIKAFSLTIESAIIFGPKLEVDADTDFQKFHRARMVPKKLNLKNGFRNQYNSKMFFTDPSSVHY